MPRSDQTKRTITRTFRISKAWDDILQVEAERQGLSVNVSMNKILRKYALFGRWADRYNALSLTPRTFREILETASEDDLAKAGARAGSDIVDIVNAMGLESNLDTFVQLMEELLGGQEFGRWFRCYHHSQGSEEIFHLQHDFGRGWSVFLREYLLSYLKALNIVDVEARVYDYAVTLKIKNQRSKLSEDPTRHRS